MASKSMKKQSKKETELQKKAKRMIKQDKTVNILLSLAFLVLVAFGIFLIYINGSNVSENSPNFISNIVEMRDRLFKKAPEIAAIVNEKEITVAELEERYKIIPEEYHDIITKDQVLSQMIDEELLLQEAEKKGYTASQEEIDEQISNIMDENMVTKEELEENLKQNDLTYDDLEEFYEKEVVLTKLINDSVLSNIKITEEDISDYYEENPDLFFIPETRNVSHLLICHNESERCESNLTKEEAFEKAEMLRVNLTPDNFAETAFEYSDEPAAVITNGNLGWVSMESPFDKTFLNATFALEEGEVSEPIETVFGYHLIIGHKIKPEDKIELETAQDQINQTLAFEQQNELFEKYLEELKEKSNIINFVAKNPQQSTE